ncbi:phage tail protein [Pseudomonas qingdaonensis]|uniref:phage tail protein n=1 Tax=Pseudomonas qingdaonensis TaxID=2056231 RepID=UPI0026603F90|nr:phage tail protein [Pseudomonas qingdaonensis]WKL65456.1 phage tail protein [Pseudomonas qingdaonensis]
MLKLNERYPGRFNNPSSDYPEGSFKNRTTPGAKDGSYLEQDWANDREGFFQSLIAAAGQEANGVVDKVGASQLFDSFLALGQSQAGRAFPTTGTGTTLVLTPEPAIIEYATYQRFSVRFNVASGDNPTINVSSKGPKSLKQYSSDGSKIAATFAANQMADIIYDGADFIVAGQQSAPDATTTAGCVAYFARNTAPGGWLKANGALVSRTTYSRLFNAIGTTFGAGDGATTFQLPDLRGLFVRGWDDGRGMNPGRDFATYEADELKSHAHDLIVNSTDTAGNKIADSNGAGTNSTASTSAKGGTETRPRNLALLACIKY